MVSAFAEVNALTLSMRLEFAGKTIDQLEKLYAAPRLIEYRKGYLSRLELRDQATLLDLGIGTAANTLLILDQFPRMQIDGADRSMEMLQYSHQKLRDRVRLVCLDAHHLSLVRGRYDFAIVSQVLSYVENPIAVLQQVKACLKPNGRILLEDSDWESFLYNSGGHPAWPAIRSAWLTQSLRIDGGRRLKEFAHEAGLKVEQAWSFHLQDDRFEEDQYGYWLAMIIANYLILNHLVKQSEMESWLTRLQELSEAESYYFGLNRMGVVATTDEHSAAQPQPNARGRGDPCDRPLGE